MNEKDKNKSKERTKWNEEDRTKLDDFREQQFVDDIPIEDLKIEQEGEKNKHHTQDDSQSEKKYRGNSSDDD
ncbi:hypothetical protein [Oceanobacillus sp. CAU 1775]